MEFKKRGFPKRFVTAWVLALYIAQTLPPLPGGTLTAWADAGTDVSAPLKTEVGQQETDALVGGTKKSNVLFLIESTAAMSFTPKGVLPQVQMVSGWDLSFVEGADWNKTRDRFGYGPADIDRMMNEATFGMGALPAAWSGQNLRPERNLYGRDVDTTNNFKKGATLEETMKLNADNYYFPFMDADNPISKGLYKSQVTGLEVGFKDCPEVWPYSTVARSTSYNSGERAGYPTDYDRGHWNGTSSAWYYDTRYSGSDFGYYQSTKPKNDDGGARTAQDTARHIRDTAAGYGDQIIAPYSYNTNASASAAYPYALVFKDPRHWRTPPDSWSEDDLVPNDSRMYQTKLVLWRLLSDPDLFKNIRFGMATTYLSPSNVELGHMRGTHHGVVGARQDYNGIFKVAPFGGNVWTIALFNGNTAYVNDPANISKAIKKGSFQNGYERIKFKNGIMTSETTGNMETHCALFGQYYPMWMNAKVQSYYDTAKVPGVPSNRSEEEDGWWSSMGAASQGSDYKAGQERDRPMFKLMNRASLWLPIEDHDYTWTKGGRTITQIDKFKLWINGVADIKSAGSTATNFDTTAVNWGDDINRASSFKGNRASQFYYYNDPEIGIAGNFYLAQAIFPDPTKYHPKKPGVPLRLDREFYHSQGYVWYSKSADHISYKIDKRRYSQEQYWSGKPRAYFNAGSGEATGSVMDFFSPKLGYTVKGSASYGQTYANESYDQLNIADGSSSSATLKVPTANISDGDLAKVSFPVTNPCEDNWVVAVASGCEPNVKGGGYEYPAWRAVKNLYDATNAATSCDFRTETGERKAVYAGVTMLDKNTGKLKTADLDNPIRTLVIGIVADPDKMMKDDPSLSKSDSVIKEIKRMRLNLIRMANAGQGLDAGKIAAITEENMYGAPYQPYFASNSAELLESFRQALVAVNKSDAVQPGTGSFVEAPPAEGEDLPSTFSTSYRIVQGDQWAGYLTRYLVSSDKEGFSTLTADWELGANILARRGGGENPLQLRNLKYWDKNDSKFKSFKADDAMFASLLGINSRVSPANLPGASFGPALPDKALYWWLQGYDYSYAGGGTKYPRSSMLADFGNSGIVYADLPSAGSNNGLPGYHAWANSASVAAVKGTERIYAQTNDGVLHVVVPSSGQEESAILPPPALLPSRMASLKTYSDGSNLLWHDVKGDEKTLGIRSNPGYTLDGPLQKRRFDLSAAGDGSFWRTLLLGTLGRGGNGLYAMDITAPAAPTFLWYRENLGDALVSMGLSDSGPAIGPASEADPYSKLGYNSPKPGMGVAGTMNGAKTNFIALPGGSQSSYDPAENGGCGATLLFIDPKDGSVIRAFDSKEVSKNSAPKAGACETGYAPYMGMMNSEPTLLRSRLPSNACMTGRVFASDNRGNVFMVSLEGQGGGEMKALSPGEWNIRTVVTLQKNIASASENDPAKVKHYSTPRGFCAGIENGKVWLGGGTANAAVKKSGKAPDGELKNDFQMIFGFCVPDADGTMIVRDDLKELDDTADTTLAPGDLQPGWYIRLRPGGQNTGEEYVTAKPVLVCGIMYIPTFRQTQRINTEKAADPCGVTRKVSGESRLYAVGIKTGGPAHWTDPATHESVKYITITDAKITEQWVRETEDAYYVTNDIDVFSDLSNL
ncbi:MAG: hypothetical protein LBL73_07725, partial [Synergistaceae bacterium]|nr:hypothetical protein [Synergistaceae bacterium]